MAGQYIYVENPLSQTPSRLEKKRLPALSESFRKEGLALELPFSRRPSDHAYPDKKVETLPIPLKSATFDPQQAHREKQILEIGETSVLNWLAKLVIAGFRVHDNASSARLAQSHQANAGTIERLINAFRDAGYQKTTIEGVTGFLSKTPRTPNDVFERATIARVVGKNLSIDPEDSLVQAIEDGLIQQADGWSKHAPTPATPELRAQCLLEALGNPITESALLGLIEQGIPEALKGYAPEYGSISFAPDSALDRDAFKALVDEGDGLFELALSRAAARCQKGQSPSEILLSKGPNYNGLSWLLNPKKGLSLWAYGDPTALSQFYGTDVEVVRHLQQDAKAIISGYKGLFGNLHDLRNQIGGTASSFAEKYISRMNEIKDDCAKLESLFEQTDLPRVLLEPASERAFWGTGFDAQSLFRDWAHVRDNVAQTKTLIDTLSGSGGLAVPGDLEAIETFMDNARLLFGRLRLVLNNISQWTRDVEAARARGNTSQAGKGAEQLERISVDQRLISALDFSGYAGQISGEAEPPAKDEDDDEPSTAPEGSGDKVELHHIARRKRSTYQSVPEMMQATRDQLNQALEQVDQLHHRLLEGDSLAEKALETFRQQDQRHYANRGIEVSERYIEIQARRHLLHEWFTFWRSLSRPAIDYAQKELVSLDLGYSDDPDNQDVKGMHWRRKAHDFMQEQKGVIWKSLFARSKAKPYGLNSEQLLAVDFNALIERMHQWLSDAYHAQAFDTCDVDYHALVAKCLEMAARTSQAQLTGDNLGVGQWPLPLTFRPAEQDAVSRQDILEPRMLARVASRLAVSIRDAASLLHRQTHSDNASFSPVGDLSSIAYISKQADANGEARMWCPPVRLWSSEDRKGEVLRDLMDEREPIAVGDLFTRIRSRLFDDAYQDQHKACRDLLAEMPHTWGVVLTVSGVESQSAYSLDDTLLVIKDKMAKAPRKGQVCEMVLKPLWSNMLDECLRNTRRNMPGSLILRYSYSKADGYAPRADQVEVHVVTSKVAPPVADPQSSPYLDRLMGVDLGERGVGFSVRRLDVDGSPLVERGFVPVPAIRKLIKATQRYRKAHQKKMSVRASHVSFDEMREAVAGNVVSVIKYLMHYYKALPVLEMNLSNLDKGAQQLSHVYSAVTDTFISRGVPTVDKARKNTWRGYNIEHPYLQRVVTDPKSKATAVKPFKLFPGTGVKAANTSRICSGCGVNPIKLLKDSRESEFVLDEKGQVELDGVTLAFYTPSSIKAVAAGKGDPEPLSSKVFAKDRLVSHLLSNQLRVGPLSQQSLETTQSRYWCPNVNCCHHNPDQLMHADMNAADNIVMRRIHSLVPVQQEQAA